MLHGDGEKEGTLLGELDEEGKSETFWDGSSLGSELIVGELPMNDGSWLGAELMVGEFPVSDGSWLGAELIVGEFPVNAMNDGSLLGALLPEGS